MFRILPLVLLLAFPSLALAQAADVEGAGREAGTEFKLDGYYRVRANWFKDPAQAKGQDVQRYFEHRFRLEPHLNLNEYIAVHAQIDALDGIWGSNPGNVLLQSTADRQPNLLVRRASAEVTTAVGIFRVGRMASHWGRGILSNDGDGFRNDFGDAYGGDTYDRILFVTKPLGIDAPLTVALLYDKIVETETPLAPQEPIIARRGDVNEAGFIIHWKQGNLGIGTYTLLRLQPETETQAWIPDLQLRYDTRRFHFLGEVVGIFGRTEAVTTLLTPGQRFEADGRQQVSPGFTLSDHRMEIEMVGYASEIGFKPMPWLDLALESGYASGDEAGTEAFGDGKLQSFTFDPDYNVGLLMWDYANRMRTEREFAALQRQFNTPVAGSTLAQQCQVFLCNNRTGFPSSSAALSDFLASTARVFGPTGGAVRNAIYLFPKVRLQPVDDVNMTLAAVWARAPEVVETAVVSNNEPATAADYGFELDGAVHYDYTDNFRIGIEGGWFKPGSIFQLANGDAAPSMFLVRPRFTVVF